MDLQVNRIICGPAETELEKLPDESVNCSISSPPYWALRDYGWDVCTLFGLLDDFVMPRSKKKRDRWWIMIRIRAQRRGGIFSPNKKSWIGALGLEPTFELYIEHLCGIYDQVQRILRKDGTCFVNLGDTYSGSGGEHKPWHKSDTGFQHNGGFSKHALENEFTRQRGSLLAKSLCLIPERFAIEMVNRGWILRNIIIWHKPNPMPSSAKDRFTVDFEQVFFFVKSKRYFFEQQYEPLQCPERLESRPFDTDNLNRKQQYDGKSLRGQGINPNTAVKSFERIRTLGRNKRCVWTIPTEAYSEAHFATFPRKLVEPMIKAGCPRYVCSKCGEPRGKIYDVKYEKVGSGTCGGRGRFNPNDKSGFTGKPTMAKNPQFKGYTDCGCGKEFRPGIVLDPFRRIGDCWYGGRSVAA